MVERYPIRIGARSAPLLLIAWGVTRDRAWAELDDERLLARFGYWRFEVAVANITGWRLEGPWSWITAIGVRRSLRHGDVSFAGSAHGGIRLQFRDTVRWTIFDVPALSIGLEDPARLAAHLEARGIAGKDARQG